MIRTTDSTGRGATSGLVLGAIGAVTLALALPAPAGAAATAAARPQPNVQMAAAQLPAHPSRPADHSSSCSLGFNGVTVWVDLYFYYSANGRYEAVTGHFERGDSKGEDVEVWYSHYGPEKLQGGHLNGYGVRVPIQSNWELTGSSWSGGVKNLTANWTDSCSRN